MLISKTAMVYGSGPTIPYYKKLGYDMRYHEYTEVAVEDLSPHAISLVLVQCDYCGVVVTRAYRDYTEAHRNNNADCCVNCRKHKIKEVFQDKYGVSNPLSTVEVRQKCQDTIKQRYGVENPMHSEEIRNKVKHTNILRYGCENPAQNQAIQQKIADTNLRKYGYKAPAQSEQVQAKFRQTCQNKYGLDYPPTLMNGIGISKTQQHLAELYNCQCNYNILGFYVDLYCSTDNTIIEYDGGGHTLAIKLDNMSTTAFYNKELQREQVLKRAGFSMLRIINSTDKQLSDSEFLNIYNKLRHARDTDNTKTWIYNIDNNKLTYR